MVIRAFAVVFSRMSFRMRQVSSTPSVSPEAYDKTAEINGFTVLQLLFEDIRLCQTIHARKKTGSPAIIGLFTQLHVRLYPHPQPPSVAAAMAAQLNTPPPPPAAQEPRGEIGRAHV